MKKKPVLAFVCTGNTCRSPMAQYILKAMVGKYPDLSVRITSYGTSVTEADLNPKAKLALLSFGFKSGKFTPKQLTVDKAKGFDAIVAMTDAKMKELVSAGYKNVYSINQLTGLGDVADPYGRDQSFYNDCCKKLVAACEIILSMLKEVLK